MVEVPMLIKEGGYMAGGKAVTLEYGERVKLPWEDGVREKGERFMTLSHWTGGTQYLPEGAFYVLVGERDEQREVAMLLEEEGILIPVDGRTLEANGMVLRAYWLAWGAPEHRAWEDVPVHIIMRGGVMVRAEA